MPRGDFRPEATSLDSNPGATDGAGTLVDTLAEQELVLCPATAAIQATATNSAVVRREEQHLPSVVNDENILKG